MRRSIPKAKPYAKCPVEITFSVITNPVLRFGELRRRVPGATQRMITLQLRELERDGCISRKIYSQMPPRVEYSITEFGRTLEPVVKALCFWGMEHGGWKPPEEAAIA
jgi:DNA-binding HxlR family transcriptional regulator